MACRPIPMRRSRSFSPLPRHQDPPPPRSASLSPVPRPGFSRSSVSSYAASAGGEPVTTTGTLAAPPALRSFSVRSISAPPRITAGHPTPSPPSPVRQARASSCPGFGSCGAVESYRTRGSALAVSAPPVSSAPVSSAATKMIGADELSTAAPNDGGVVVSAAVDGVLSAAVEATSTGPEDAANSPVDSSPNDGGLNTTRGSALAAPASSASVSSAATFHKIVGAALNDGALSAATSTAATLLPPSTVDPSVKPAGYGDEGDMETYAASVGLGCEHVSSTTSSSSSTTSSSTLSTLLEADARDARVRGSTVAAPPPGVYSAPVTSAVPVEDVGPAELSSSNPAAGAKLPVHDPMASCGYDRSAAFAAFVGRGSPFPSRDWDVRDNAPLLPRARQRVSRPNRDDLEAGGMVDEELERIRVRREGRKRFKILAFVLLLCHAFLVGAELVLEAPLMDNEVAFMWIKILIWIVVMMIYGVIKEILDRRFRITPRPYIFMIIHTLGLGLFSGLSDTKIGNHGHDVSLVVAHAASYSFELVCAILVQVCLDTPGDMGDVAM